MPLLALLGIAIIIYAVYVSVNSAKMYERYSKNYKPSKNSLYNYLARPNKSVLAFHRYILNPLLIALGGFLLVVALIS